MSVKAKSKIFWFSFVIAILIAIPSLLMAHPAVQLLDRNGNPIINQLDKTDKIVAANGSVYYKGPAYSPKQTCGKCHDYKSITMAYHFREGVGPYGKRTDDLWVSKNQNNTLQKYLTHAYGHLEAGGQFGAW